ncbi:hypothetical protein P4E94_01865 [Pontiellaceae bacterium B12219]|nr:hypothetical protein [Pontiellaceae bacterium B12219]
MHSVPAIRKMRTRNFKLWVSSLALVGFIASFFFCCLCGPYCGNDVAVAEHPAAVSDSCCLAHHKAPVSESCGAALPGELCCETDPTGYVLQDSGSLLQIDVPSVILFVADYIAAEQAVLYSSAPELRAAGYIPPLYLRFHSFLI